MRHHIDVLGLLHLVWGVFGVLAGVSLAILAAGTRAAMIVGAANSSAARAGVWVLGMSAVVLLISGAACFVIGRGLRRHQPRARLAATVLAIPNLIVIPFGTALSVYTFWVLLNNDTRAVFGWPPRAAS